jgi:hypothetical protein
MPGKESNMNEKQEKLAKKAKEDSKQDDGYVIPEPSEESESEPIIDINLDIEI